MHSHKTLSNEITQDKHFKLLKRSIQEEKLTMIE